MKSAVIHSSRYSSDLLDRFFICDVVVNGFLFKVLLAMPSVFSLGCPQRETQGKRNPFRGRSNSYCEAPSLAAQAFPKPPTPMQSPQPPWKLVERLKDLRSFGISFEMGLLCICSKCVGLGQFVSPPGNGPQGLVQVCI